MSFSLSPFTPPRCRTSDQKGGVAPSTSTPLVLRAVPPDEGGTREAQPRFALSFSGREIRFIPRPIGRSRKVLNHNGERAAL